MSYKIGGIEQNYNALDFKELQSDLNLADVEDMDDSSYAIAKYRATGERPDKISLANAKNMGLRHSFWDIYSPVEGVASGTWRLDKDAVTGEEFITRKESNLKEETK